MRTRMGARLQHIEAGKVLRSLRENWVTDYSWPGKRAHKPAPRRFIVQRLEEHAFYLSEVSLKRYENGWPIELGTLLTLLSVYAPPQSDARGEFITGALKRFFDALQADCLRDLHAA